MIEGEYRGDNGRRLDTITVRQLRELLERWDDDALVVASCDYGDHVHTEQAIMLGELTEVELAGSAYSQSGFKVLDPNDDPEPVMKACPDCDGTGLEQGGDLDATYNCLTCEGAGELEVRMPIVLCFRS